MRLILLGFLLGCRAGEAEPPPAAAPAAAEEPRSRPPPPRPNVEGPQPTLEIIPLTVGSATVRAEVADTPESRRLGLMQRQDLCDNCGMLFVYPQEDERSFWMRNTVLPLSIAYVSAAGIIVHIADMRPLDESPVPSLAPAMYALEMDQGWFAQRGVKPGDRIEGLPAPAAE